MYKRQGLDGPQPDRTFVWIPSRQAVVGGVVVFGNLHVWTADTQSPQSVSYTHLDVYKRQMKNSVKVTFAPCARGPRREST